MELNIRVKLRVFLRMLNDPRVDIAPQALGDIFPGRFIPESKPVFLQRSGT